MKHLLYLPKIMGGRPMRQLTRLAALTFALFCCLQTALAYDFSAVSPSGHTIYYNIVEGGYQIPRVSVTYPNTSESPWGNIQKPYGNLVLPETVTYNGTTYNVAYIGEKAFQGCAGLASVVIPSFVLSINYNSFSGCESLTKVTINSDSITSGPYSSGMSLNNIFGSQVTNIVIGPVTTIGSFAFFQCSNLETVTIPSSVQYIGNCAFLNCGSLYRVFISDLTAWCRINFANETSNPLYQAHHLYLNNSLVTHVSIPNTMTSIKKYAFYGCSDLTSVEIPNSVTFIGENAFRDCTGLSSVFIPAGVSSINEGTFRGCTSLTSVDLPYLIEIGDYAFYHCNSLNNLVIPNSVVSIGTHAFEFCSSLTSVTIPSSVNTIGQHAFDACPQMTSVTINSNAIVSVSYSYNNNFRHIFGDYARSFTFGSGVTSIGAYAFWGCNHMTSVTLPGSLTSIGYSAFEHCLGLNRVQISDLNAWYAIDFANAYANPLYYANHFYVNTNEVVNLTVTSNISEIKDYAFVGYKGLHSVSIGYYVTSIGNSAFENCSGLNSVTIGNSVNTIGDDAFKDCTNLTSVTLNNSAIASADYTSTNNLKTIFGNQVTNYTFGAIVYSIGKYACYGCTGLTSLTFPNTLQTIGLHTFNGCTSLTSVTLPSSLYFIDQSAFQGCSGLNGVVISNLAAWCAIDFGNAYANPLCYAKHLYLNNNEVINLTIPSSVSEIKDFAFTGSTGLHSVTFHSDVTSIGSQAFKNCTHLSALNIPSTMASIGEYAFENCSGMTSLTLPSNMSSISHGVFYNCTGLTEIHAGATVPPIIAGSTTFGNVPTAIPVYVPLGSAPSYQAAQYWSRFTNYVGAIVPGDLTVTVPYEQEFYQSFIPGKWTSYEGQLVWNGSINKYTANLSTNIDHWYFGFVNGVFLSSHAWANIGNTNHAFWLVSPIMHLDGEYNMLSFDMALTQASGFLTPVTPGAQNNTRIFALVSTDHGLTWTKLEAWKHGLGGYTEIESLTPHATTLEYNLASYADQDIMVGFYVDCSNANDAANRVHIDNFFIGEFDPSTPPTVAVDDITGYTATVSWAPAFAWQQGWDFYYKSEYDGVPYPNYASLETLQATGRFFHLTETSYALQNLTANTFYQVWVRHRDGSETGSWSSPLGFTTTSQCAPPKNPQVETTQTTATITWEPGQPNQTSWYIWVDPYHDMEGDSITSPSFTMTNLTPGQEFEAEIYGYCGGDDGNSESISVEFSTDDYDHLTVNDGTDYNEFVVIVGDETGEAQPSGHSRSQFIIPAEMLTEMQYSTIQKISFYSGQSGQPWGSGASFQVFMKEVDFFDFDEEGLCGDSFYDWDDLYQFNNTTLRIENGKMTIESGSGFGFHYTNGNLLIGIRQNWVGNNCQVAWYGVGTTPIDPAMYEPSGYDPQCVQFLPKTTFTYESDHYNPPTDFYAEPISSNEVHFSWTPCEGATAYEIEVSESLDFGEINDQHLAVLTGYEYTWVDYDLLGPDNTYYARIRALYESYGVIYGSSWSEGFEFGTLGYCPKPDSLTATETGNLTVELDWTENGDATQWVIAFKAEGEIGERGITVYEHPFTLTAPYLEPSTTYTARVRPMCENGGFVFSDPITFTTSSNIVFADQNVKALCVTHWDSNGDGELSFAEATAVTGLGTVFQNKSNIHSFDELQYFTGLTSINSNAFYNCIHLTSVVVPSGVTSLESYAFQLCTNLETVILPNTLTEIKSNAFRKCNALTDIELPESLTTIGTTAFYECTSLTSIFIPASVTTIDANPFMKNNLEFIFVDPANAVFDSRDNCNAIMKKSNNQLVVGCKNTVIPSTALSIWDHAFRECEGLTSIYIPENIHYIYSNAFCGCTALTSVNIPSQVEKIYYCSFQDCSSLTSITLPSGVTEIQTLAFYGCSSLSEMTLLSTNPPTVGENAFAYVDKTIPVYVPCERVGAYHSAAGWSEFSNMIDSCVINFADQNVKALCVANWDTSGDGELSYTEAAAVTSLGEVFKSKTNITSFDELQYFTGLTAINSQAFYMCTYLTSVVVPENVLSIENSAFQQCTRMTSIVLPDGMQVIRPQAFYSCGLTHIDIPETVTVINRHAFASCHGLTEVSIPSSVYLIGNFAFQNCDGLTSIFIPATVTSLGDNIVSHCTNLVSIEVDPGNPNYDSRYGCNAIIETSTNKLISGCSSTIIPEDVTAIGTSAFQLTAPTEITIPSGVTFIGDHAFWGCTGMVSITLLCATPPTLDNDVFTNVPKYIPVYVPCGSLAAYQAAAGWSDFTNIVSEGCLQTITLNGGWNWWAPTIEMELGDIETNLGNRGILILSQNEGFARYENAWSGTLSEVGLGKMYKIQLTAGDPVLFEVEGGLSSGTAVTIEPGFNWIGYTGPAGLSIAEALGSFEPNEGDEIIDENGDSVYYDGENWEGNFTSLNPGKGYLYHSVANETKTITL